MEAENSTFLPLKETYTDFHKEKQDMVGGPLIDLEKQKDKFLPPDGLTGQCILTFSTVKGEKKKTKDKRKIVSFSESNHTRLFKKKGQDLFYWQRQREEKRKKE